MDERVASVGIILSGILGLLTAFEVAVVTVAYFQMPATSEPIDMSPEEVMLR